MPKNQTFILNQLLEANKSTEILAETKYDPATKTIRVRAPTKTEFVELVQFLQNPKDAEYLEKQFVLFVGLCSGRHGQNIEELSKRFIPFDLAMAGMTDERLTKGAIRAQFCGLVHALYVDVGKNRIVLKRIQVRIQFFFFSCFFFICILRFAFCI
jgi:hypothetical protein